MIVEDIDDYKAVRFGDTSCSSDGAVITFHVSRRRRVTYIGLSVATCPYHCTDPDVTWGNGRECPLVVHYWADLQLVHGFRYYDDVA